MGDYHGFCRTDFCLNGREAILVEPRRRAAGSPWIWRTEFFGAFDTADCAMLEQGYCLLYYRVSDLYGCDMAISLLHGFYQEVVGRYGLAPRAVLFGFSRGGLYAVNYAYRHPDEVEALYLDAPVLDLTSWPGGMGAAPRCDKEWSECCALYGFRNDEDARAFRGNPIDRLPHMQVPVILVAGAADSVVPYPENGGRFATMEYGAPREILVKPECDHHPHSLSDPTPIVSFLLSIRRAASCAE